QVTDGKWEVRSIDSVDEAKGVIYFSGTEHSHVGVQAYRIKLDGTGLQRLTASEGSHKATFGAGSKFFIDSWSDVNSPTQTRLYDTQGKLVRVIEENKVDALKQYKLGTA